MPSTSRAFAKRHRRRRRSTRARLLEVRSSCSRRGSSLFKSMPWRFIAVSGWTCGLLADHVGLVADTLRCLTLLRGGKSLQRGGMIPSWCEGGGADKALPGRGAI